MKKKDLQREMNEFFRSNLGDSYDSIKSVIDGHSCKLNSLEVRYLQVKCVKMSKNGKYDEFCKRFKIFDRYGRQIIICEDGYLSESINSGFLDREYFLSRQLL